MISARPKVNSSSAMWPLLMDAPQAPHLDRRADQPAQQRRDDQRRPEADIEADRVGEIGAQHVGAGMGEIQHAHHAEDERQPARQHEQQHAVDEAVQERDDKDFHATRPPQGDGPLPVGEAGDCCSVRRARTLHLAGVGLVDVLGEDRRRGRPAEPGAFGVVLHALLEGADEVFADDLVVFLAHLGVEAEEVLDRAGLPSRARSWSDRPSPPCSPRPADIRRWCGSRPRRSRTCACRGSPW